MRELNEELKMLLDTYPESKILFGESEKEQAMKRTLEHIKRMLKGSIVTLNEVVFDTFKEKFIAFMKKLNIAGMVKSGKSLKELQSEESGLKMKIAAEGRALKSLTDTFKRLTIALPQYQAELAGLDIDLEETKIKLEVISKLETESAKAERKGLNDSLCILTDRRCKVRDKIEDLKKSYETLQAAISDYTLKVEEAKRQLVLVQESLKIYNPFTDNDKKNIYDEDDFWNDDEMLTNKEDFDNV